MAKGKMSEEDFAHFGDWLLDQRRVRKVTVQELSERSGIEQGMISAIEMGLRHPTLQIVETLIGGLNQSGALTSYAELVQQYLIWQSRKTVLFSAEKMIQIAYGKSADP